MRPMVLAESVLGDGRHLQLVQAGDSDAEAASSVIRDAFSHRPPVDPPPPALSETPEKVRAALAKGFGVLAVLDRVPAGVVLVGLEADVATIGRVSVRPPDQGLGIASAMVSAVLARLAMQPEVRTVELIARAEFPQVVAWWRRHGFVEVSSTGPSLLLARQLPVCFVAATAEETQSLGRRLARVVRAGDLIIASGELGAGKTTLAQGLGAGLGVTGAVISPTFVLSRVHPSAAGGPALVHVDAYRLGSAAELDDLDLDFSVADSVTLVEWGAGLAEGLSSDRLEIDLRRSLDPADETRWIFLTPVGERWVNLRSVLEEV